MKNDQSNCNTTNRHRWIESFGRNRQLMFAPYPFSVVVNLVAGIAAAVAAAVAAAIAFNIGLIVIAETCHGHWPTDR